MRGIVVKQRKSSQISGRGAPRPYEGHGVLLLAFYFLPFTCFNGTPRPYEGNDYQLFLGVAGNALTENTTCALRVHMHS